MSRYTKTTVSLLFVGICAAATDRRSRTAAVHQLHSGSSLPEVCVALCLMPCYISLAQPQVPLALCIFLGTSFITKRFYKQEPEIRCTSCKGCVPQTHLIFPLLCLFSHAFSSVVTRWQLQSVVDISVVDGAGSSHLLHRWTLGISPSLLLIDAGLLMLSIRQPNLFPIEATRVLHQQLYSVAYVHEP
jgi:hypothetical protein